MRLTPSSSRLDLDDALADQAAVGLDLGFAGAAQKAEAAALALQMGPAPHQPRALIGQMRQLDLQPPFPGARAFAEDFQDQRGAVQHLGVPGLLQIALLHRRELGVDDDDFRLERLAPRRRSPPPCRCRSGWPASAAPAARCCATDHVEADGGGQADRFGQARLAHRAGCARLARFGLDMDDEGRARRAPSIVRRWSRSGGLVRRFLS